MSSATVLGPLTTPFVQQSYCSRGLQFSYGDIGEGYERGMTCSDGKPVRATLCFPGIKTSDPIAMYSPGIACPVDWTSISMHTDSRGESTIACCPSSFTAFFADDGYHSCESKLATTPGPLDVAKCLENGPVELVATRTRNAAVGVFAMQVVVVVESSARFTTFTGPITATSSSSFPSSSTTPHTSPGPTIAVTSSTQPDKKAFPAGAIAGIVIGSLALILLFAAIFFLKHRRHKHSNAVQKTHSGLPEFVAVGAATSHTKSGHLSSPKASAPTDMSMTPQANTLDSHSLAPSYRDTRISNAAYSEMSGSTMAASHLGSPHQNEFVSQNGPNTLDAHTRAQR